MSNGGYACVLEGLSRIALHMDEFSPPSLPFHETRVDILKTTPLPQSSPLLGQLQTTATSALATLGAASALSPLLTRRLRGMLANLSPESAPALVDAMMGSIALTTPTTTNGLTLEDKLAVLAAVNGEERVKLGIEILSRCDETIALKKRIEGKVGDAMTRRQREFLLMQQLQAIRQELEELSKQEGSGIKIVGGNGRKSGPGANGPAGGDEEEEGEVDDMAELEKAIKAKKWTPEARKVVSREFKRLKKSPPQGAEHGVIRESGST
jgi:ATP-dependent Lon protease